MSSPGVHEDRLRDLVQVLEYNRELINRSNFWCLGSVWTALYTRRAEKQDSPNSELLLLKSHIEMS